MPQYLHMGRQAVVRHTLCKESRSRRTIWESSQEPFKTCSIKLQCSLVHVPTVSTALTSRFTMKESLIFLEGLVRSMQGHREVFIIIIQQKPA